MKLFSGLMFVFLLFSCTSKIEVRGKVREKSAATEAPVISQLLMANGLLKIEGKNLNSLKSLRLVDGRTQIPLHIVEEQKNYLLTKTEKIALISLNKIFSLITTDALGAETIYKVSFTLTNGSVTAAMLSSMGANNGDVLTYNAEEKKWQPQPLSGLEYHGTWDATLAKAPQENPNAGDYWIVSKKGITDLDGQTEWQVGDWVIFNGEKWQRLKNSNDVLSFNGRQGVVVPQNGDYTWEQIDKSQSSLKDIADVANAEPSVGQVLKWSGTAWTPENDTTASVDVSTVNSTSIADGSIVNVDINATAAIEQSKIAGLVSDLNAKMPLNSLDTTAALGTSDTKVPSQNAVKSYVDTLLSGKESTISVGTTAQYYRGDKTWQTLNSTVVEEGMNLYFSDARARNAAVADAINDGTANIAPSQNAVHDALASKFAVDGSLPMTGHLKIGVNQIQFKDDDTENIVSLQAPIDLTGNVQFVLPSSIGSAAQVLKTDGNGQLYWAQDIGSGTQSISSNSIENNSIINEDINVSAAIAQSKIAGLESDLNGKMPLNSLDTTAALGTSDTKVPSQNAVKSYVDTLLNGKENTISVGINTQYFRGDKTWQTLNSTVVEEGMNLYFSDARARNAAVVDAINDGTTNTAPSQNAVFDALTAKVSTNGSTILTGDLQTGANGVKFKDLDNHTVTMKAPENLNEDMTFVLPSTNGNANQVLKTDGNGNLTWAEDLTNVVAVGTVDSVAIVDGSILNIDIADNAAIAQSKIQNLTTDLAAKINMSAIDITTTLGTDDAKIPSQKAVKAYVDATVVGKQDALTSGTSAQYFKGDLTLGTFSTDVRNSAVADAINNGTTNIAPSQNAVFDALATKLAPNDTLTGLVQSTIVGHSYVTGGNLGIGTNTPQVTLDVAGQMRLTKNASEPVACNATTDGAITLTNNYRSCTCRNGVGWTFTHNGGPCVWTTQDIVPNGAGRRWSDGSYATSCKEYKNPSGNYLYEGYVGSGIYTIDPDGAGTTSNFNVYCDMKTDGGGWTLVLNYLHKGGENDETVVMTGTTFPIQKSTVLGTDESNDAESFGHASNLTMQKLSTINEVRLFCQTSNHTRKIHFATTSTHFINYFRTGTGQVGINTSGLPYMRVEYNVRFLELHSAYIPTSVTANYTNQGDKAMTEFPFYFSSGGIAYIWGISGGTNRWECDDFPNNYAEDTHHQVWVR